MRPPPRSTLFPYTTLFRSVIDMAAPKKSIASTGVAFGENSPGTFPKPSANTTPRAKGDRKSTRLNSSHVENSYAVYCLKKKKNTQPQQQTQHKTHHLHTTT